MSSRLSRFMQARLPGAELVGAAGVAEREHLLDVADLREAVGGAAADPLGRRVGGDQLRVLLPRARAARASARRTRRRRSSGRRARSSGGRPRRSAARSSARALGVGALIRRRPCRARRRAPSRSQSPSRSSSPWSVRSKWIGVIATRPAGDRVEVGALLVLVRGLEAVDLVAPAAAVVLLDQLELVVVEALAEAGELDPARLAGGAVDVDQRRRRAAARRSACARPRGRSPAE